MGHRIRQVAAIKAHIAGQLGEPVSFGGPVVHAFLAPHHLAGLCDFPDLSARKPERLRAIAAAQDGRPDATTAPRPC